MLPDHDDIVSYILSNYKSAKKLVEVGVGGETSVYLDLKNKSGIEVLATDITRAEGTIFDDLMLPKIGIYKGADLIYSIRPNPELLTNLRRVAEEVGASLLVRPLSSDSCHKPKSMTLVNFGKAVLWEEKF